MTAFRTKVKPPTSASVTYSVIAQGSFVAKLGWTPSVSAWPNSYYVIYRDDEEFVTSLTGTTYRDTTVLEGESHNYVVSTVNVNEVESPVGQGVAVAVPFYPVWQTGWSLSVDQNTTASIAGRASDPGGGSITYSKQGGTAPAGVTVSGAGLVAVGATAGGNYSLILRASNGALTSDTTISLAVTVPITAPGPIENFNMAAVSSSQINGTWNLPSSGVTPTVLDLDQALSAGGPWSDISLSAAATSVQITGLSANTQYFYRMRCGNSGQFSSYVTDNDTTDAVSSAADFLLLANANAYTFDGNATSRSAAFVSGPSRAVQAGDIIELAAGVHGDLQFTNIVGTAANPITIRGPQTGTQPAILRSASNHSGGFANILGPFFRYVTIDGQSSTVTAAGPLGKRRNIKIMYSTATGNDNPAGWLKLKGNAAGTFSMPRDFTIRYVELDGGYGTRSTAGIGFQFLDHNVKLATYPGQWVENIVIEHCYLHHTGNEGMYIGPNPYMVVRGTGSEAGGRDVPLRNIKVRYCELVDIARNAINPKSWFGGSPGINGNAIHDNYCLRCGQVGPTAQSNCIEINSGKIDVFNNTLVDCGGTAIAVNISEGCVESDPALTFTLNVYNNLIVRFGQSFTSKRGIYAFSYQGGNVGAAIPAAMRPKVFAYNNTIVDGAGTSINLDSSAHASSFARNNILLGNSTNGVSTGAGSEANNLTSGITQSALFVSPASSSTDIVFDYHLNVAQLASGIIGTDIAATDIEGTARSLGNADKGAYEF